MKKNAGFTVIETLLVLAIAGLILLLVLEAIPALTRNSRNNQRKQDVQTILQAISRYELNNSGNIPDTAQLQASLTNSSRLTIYDPTSVTVIYSNLDSASAIAPNPLNPDTVQVYNHAKCNPNSPGQATNFAAGYNDVAALYSIDTSRSVAGAQCQQL